MTTPPFFNEKKIHVFFEVSLFVKGAFAFFEIVGGILIYAVPQRLILNLVATLTQAELAEDPRDPLANYLVIAAHHLSVETRHFAAFYLASHGAIKLWLIAGLLRERLWYYPTALIVFGVFIAYQLYRYSFSYSPFLLFITLVDIVVILLTWHEYGFLRHHRSIPS